jgi:hypothetical protein
MPQRRGGGPSGVGDDWGEHRYPYRPAGDRTAWRCAAREPDLLGRNAALPQLDRHIMACKALAGMKQDIGEGADGGAIAGAAGDGALDGAPGDAETSPVLRRELTEFLQRCFHDSSSGRFKPSMPSESPRSPSASTHRRQGGGAVAEGTEAQRVARLTPERRAW